MNQLFTKFAKTVLFDKDFRIYQSIILFHFEQNNNSDTFSMSLYAQKCLFKPVYYRAHIRQGERYFEDSAALYLIFCYIFIRAFDTYKIGMHDAWWYA